MISAKNSHSGQVLWANNWGSISTRTLTARQWKTPSSIGWPRLKIYRATPEISVISSHLAASTLSWKRSTHSTFRNSRTKISTSRKLGRSRSSRRWKRCTSTCSARWNSGSTPTKRQATAWELSDTILSTSRSWLNNRISTSYLCWLNSYFASCLSVTIASSSSLNSSNSKRQPLAICNNS